MRKLVQLRTVPLDARTRRLGACYDISDLRRAAKRRIPRPVFDYVDGAADEEISVAANVAAFRSWRFLPRVLAGVAVRRHVGAGSRLDAAGADGVRADRVHPDAAPGRGDRRGPLGLPARAAVHAVHDGDDRDRGAAGRGGAGGWPAELWFQLYLTRDRAQAYNLVELARHGYTALVVTVDTVVAGNRVRDLRNGLSIPPELTLATIASVGAKPGYWYQLLSGAGP